MNAYELKNKSNVEEIAAEASIYEHKKTGAKIFTLKCDDDNKVFAIGFRTPVDDSTGVPHIIEHTVLCGSEKYPCKDPFIELAKGSLNTFLNAMTYPDKTVYPVASCNDKDFANLMDVYLDAVFHPNIYREEKIFKQEGWHYELEDATDELKINGVVYNEMKGVYSSLDGIMEAAANKELFPGHNYAEESGGDPDVIPELTYENFIDFHKRYYHPSNSYIYLYGNMDMEATLEKIDRDYLSKYEMLKIDSAIPESGMLPAPVDKIYEYSISDSESEENKTVLSINWKVGGELDPVKYTALQILDYILLEVPGAPIQEALIKAGIGDDITGGYCNGIRDPYFGIVAKNTEADKKNEFLKIIRDTLEKQVEGDLDHEAILAAINVYEFRAREADYGMYPKGLMYGLQSFDSWLYDGDPTMHLRYNGVFAKLKEEIEKGYFENIIKENILNNPSPVVLTFVPKKGLTTKKEEELKAKLAKIKAAMSPEEIEKVIEETKALKAYQSEPSREEDLLKIPMLKREDISRKTPEYDGRIIERDGLKYFYSNVFTSGICYLKCSFDLRNLDPEDIPYAELLTEVLGYIDTEKHSYAQLATLTNLNSGGIGFNVEAFPVTTKHNEAIFTFAANAKVLYNKIGFACHTIEEMLFESKLDDVERLRDIVSESKAKTKETMLYSGHQTALNYAGSKINICRWFNDNVRGIGFLRMLENVDIETLPEKLKDLCRKIFTRENLIIDVICDDEKLIDEIKLEGLYENADLPNHISSEHQVAKMLDGGIKTAFTTASQVNYVARFGDFRKHGFDTNGALNVLRVILNYNYLWNNIRVLGGAYGCSSVFASNGGSGFTSYRDPNLTKTNEIYEGVVDYVANYEADEREMTKSVIGCMSEMDAPVSPLIKGLRAFGNYYSNYTYEMRQKSRDEMLNVTPEDIRNLKDIVKAVLDDGAVCAIGNEKQIKENAAAFDTVEPLYGK